MKARSLFAALFVITLLAIPQAFGQRGPILDLPINPVPTADVTRLFTTAILVSPTGERIGKARTITVQRNGEVRQGVKIKIPNVTPNTEYALVIDATLVGTATSDANGLLKFVFAAPAKGRALELPDSLKPIAAARSVSIFEVSGQRLIGSGQFSGAGPK